MPRNPLEIAFGLPFEEAIKAAEARGIKLPEDYYDPLQILKRREAFTVSGLTTVDQIQGVLDRLADKLKDGGSMADFQRWATSQDFGLSPHRLETIYRNAVQTAYNAGQWRSFEEHKASRPYLMYDAINDGRTRPAHRALDNIIRPVDDPFWKTHSPMLGHRCRCGLLGLTQAQAEARSRPDKDGNPQGMHRPVTPEMKADDEGWGRKPTEWGETLDKVKSDKLSKTGAKIREAADNALKNQPNPRPWKAGTETEEGKWHDITFAKSQQWVKDGIAKRGELKGGVTDEKLTGHAGALYHPLFDRIFMYEAGDKTKEHDRATWRHEYGHALDYALADGYKFRSDSADFTDAMKKDAAELVTLGGHGPASRNATKAAKKALDEAYKKAQNSLVDLDDSDARIKWLGDRYEQAGLDFTQFEKTMMTHAVFAVKMQGIGLQARYTRAIVAIEQRDAQGLMDALTGGMDASAGRERSATFDKGALGKLSDLFGSATKNKVSGLDKSGRGHTNKYYNKGEYLAKTECFANLLALYGDESEVFGKIADIMTPSMAKLFKEILK